MKLMMEKRRFPEMSVEIDDLHQQYIKTPESPQKIEVKNRLDGSIVNFLCNVPHGAKFQLLETYQVLDAIDDQSNENFSIVKIIGAWNAIASYANNLIAQPWRVEYRSIKMYSGFYKLQVEPILDLAHLMFEAMGYKMKKGLLEMEQATDVQRVSVVSKDAMKAAVECQIIKTIFSDAIKATGHCSWKQVYMYRETHMGGTELACRDLNRSFLKFKNPVMTSSPPDPYHMMAPMMVPKPPAYVPERFRFRAPAPTYFGPPYSRYPYAAPAYIPIDPRCHACPVYDPSYAYRGVQSDNTYRPPSSRYQVLDARERSHRRSSSEHLMDRALTDYGRKGSLQREERRDDSWGYVYQGLATKSRPTASDQHVSDIDEALKSCHLEHTNVATCGVEENLEELQKPLSRRRAREVPLNKLEDQPDSTAKANAIEKWECHACTYHNVGPLDVCDMCGKSKIAGSEVLPLASGGRECPKCTLVNQKGIATCDACGTSLQGSPTYI